MSTFDEASLVFIPSGYKTSKAYSVKPSDGSGDLVFSRSNDTATRVGPDGLIEKVRTNVLLQSNTFSNVIWQVTGTPTLTANYDTNPLTGANDAWRFQSASTSDRIFQAFSGSFHNFSLYAKGTGTIRLRDSSGTYAFNMVLTSSWQRASVHIAASFGNVQITSDGGCDATIYAAQLETGDIATDYIATTTAAVSVGPVANVPRLDYLNSSCPRLLLEPQRTNIVPNSEQFDNATWSNNGTLVANQGVSPDGYTNADLFYSTTGTGKRIFDAVTITSATAYTSSVFAKAAGKSFIYFPDVDNITNSVWFNLSNGTFSTPIEGTATMVDYGNGWYRCSLTTTSTTTTGYSYVGISDASGSTTFTQNGTDGVLIWGAQLEAGSYATSYIPTLGAAVTRGADAASKTGISSLIGQTEGTIYGEFDMSLTGATSGSRKGLLFLSDGTFNNRIEVTKFGGLNATLADDIHIRITAGGVGQFDIKVKEDVTGLQKIAFAYKSGETACYINGVQVYTNSSAISIPSTSFYQIGDAYSTPAGEPLSQALLFKTRLTNAQLAELTTI